MKQTRLIAAIAVSALLPLWVTTASADGHASRGYGPSKVRVGVSDIDPTKNGGDVERVKSNAAVTFNAVYMINDNIGVELLAATPFQHDIIVGGANIGDTKHLPPTLSGQYYFNNESKFTPYVGLGLNYTYFFSETTSLGGGDLKLDPSFGLAYQIGVDYALDDNWLINLDLRKIDIESDWEIDGGATASGEARIDPTLIGLNIGYRF